MEANGLPSRTSILTAAARALGGREPDASVRNPDRLAERLIGPPELALIAGHPIGTAFDGPFEAAINDPDVFGFVWLMLVRTRHIDTALERAVRGGAGQVVILGAGFDTRAHRFGELLNGAPVIEVDYGVTQEYKRRRVHEALGGGPANLVYAPVDFTKDTLADVLDHAGFNRSRQTFFICEGVSMYVPEEGMQETLRAIAAIAPAGSTLLLEYVNRGGLDVLLKDPSALVKSAAGWGEPFVFGVPDGEDRDYFRALGLELGEALKIGGRESVARYATRADGTYYGSHLAPLFEQRRQASLEAMDAAAREQAARAAVTSGYWLAELTVR